MANVTIGIDRLKTVFRTALDLPDTVDIMNLEYQAVPNWDSVAHMGLVAEMESTFDIMLETQDVIDMSSFSKAVEILKKYDVDFES